MKRITCCAVEDFLGRGVHNNKYKSFHELAAFWKHCCAAQSVIEGRKARIYLNMSQIINLRDSWIKLPLAWLPDPFFLYESSKSRLMFFFFFFNGSFLVTKLCCVFTVGGGIVFDSKDVNKTLQVRNTTPGSSVRTVTAWLSASSRTDFPTFLVSLCSLNSTFSAHWTSRASRGL